MRLAAGEGVNQAVKVSEEGACSKKARLDTVAFVYP